MKYIAVQKTVTTVNAFVERLFEIKKIAIGTNIVKSRTLGETGFLKSNAG